MEPLRTEPEASAFVPLAEHQSRTPSSFHSGPAVLHYHSKQCKLVVLENDLVASPALSAIRGPSTQANGSSDSAPASHENDAANGDSEGKEIVVEGVDVWVTSDKFLLYNTSLSAGVSIPYPSISLHAIQRLRLPSSPDTEVQGLYMQIATPGPATQEDDEEESMIMTLVPPTDAAPATEDQSDNKPEETPTQALYAAVSACANLHPDPMEEDDDEEEGEDSLLQSGLVSMGSGNGGLPPPMNGSSGWITAENMHEYFDEDGNWIAGGEEPTLPLGPGAGTTRTREEEDGQDGDSHGDGQGDDETKWRRTD